jgi:hypothetical protein
MKTHTIAIFLKILCLSSAVMAEQKSAKLEEHAEASSELADAQDELSADVQQLVIEQTIPQVIELFGEVEGIMDETTDFLASAETGGETIAAQTEIIEKIHEAAKQKQNQEGSGKAGSAMMDMMERMMGKKKDEQGKGEKEGKEPGKKSGEGQSGDSNAANSESSGSADGKFEQRKVPKAAGSAGKNLPQEFQDAMDAYNRGLEKNSK